jgi:signal transduction histidine kinase/CheY-like chemotaxis protein
MPYPLRLEPAAVEPHALRVPVSSETEFRRLLERLPAGAYTCDTDGLITYFNQHAVDLWGREPKLNDPLDRFCGSFRLFASDGAPLRHDKCWMALALHTAKGYNGQEIIIERPDGQRLTVLAHANPIRDESGKLIGAVNVLVDISDRKRIEDALREADRSKNEFLATLAHELRNPLAPLRNAVQVLRMQDTHSPDAQWAIEVIERQTQQMTRLVDDLLDVSRITRNRLELRRERVALENVLRVAVETSRPLIDAAGHELTLKLPDQPLYLDADLTRLAQVVSNLLNNAAKYTEHRGHITLNAERQGSDAVIAVRDDGVGIPAEMLSRIFDMFTQVDHSVSRSQGGLGIGLTLVKRLVELHGGSIEAFSDGPGKGSEFVLRLPVLIESPQRLDPASRDDGRTHAASSLRVLVVDDSRDSANTMAMLLRITGNTVRTAYDGEEAVAAAAEFKPDVVLLDIGMPKVNGYEAAEHLRRQRGGDSVVLIALTGWGQEDDKQRSKEAGFDHHMVKPVEPKALLQLLASLQKTVSASHGQ